MNLRQSSAILFCIGALGVTDAANAQQRAAANPSDVVPDKMPFNIPYGAPISLQRAQAAIHAATEEATKRGWPLNVTVVDSGGNLVAFARMDGGQLASITISEQRPASRRNPGGRPDSSSGAFSRRTRGTCCHSTTSSPREAAFRRSRTECGPKSCSRQKAGFLV